MQKTTSIPVQLINPFVRYVHQGTICTAKKTFFIQSYDCCLFYILDGMGMLYAKSRLGTFQEGTLLRKGSLVILSAGTKYNLSCKQQNPLALISVNFDYTQQNRHMIQPIPPDPFYNFSADRLLKPMSLQGLPQLQMSACLDSQECLEPLLLSILKAYEQQAEYCREYASGLLKAVLCECFRQLVSQDHITKKPVAGIVEEVIAYINAHYMENISNESIGDHFGYHPNYLSKQMLLFTGESLHQFLISMRVSCAMELLLSTNAPVADISASTGFKSVCHFSKVFLQHTGVSPSAMRAEKRDSLKGPDTDLHTRFAGKPS